MSNNKLPPFVNTCKWESLLTQQLVDRWLWKIGESLRVERGWPFCDDQWPLEIKLEAEPNRNSVAWNTVMTKMSEVFRVTSPIQPKEHMRYGESSTYTYSVVILGRKIIVPSQSSSVLLIEE